MYRTAVLKADNTTCGYEREAEEDKSCGCGHTEYQDNDLSGVTTG